jgi:hypothetical protein
VQGNGEEGEKMSDPKTIYVVTEGDYSDFHIVGVFDDKARAETLSSLIEDSSVEEWPLNPPFEFDARVHAGMTLWRVACYLETWVRPSFVKWHASQKNPLEATAGAWTPEFLDPEYGHIFVWARDGDHALKIAQDKRAQFLAEQAGIA